MPVPTSAPPRPAPPTPILSHPEVVDVYAFDGPGTAADAPFDLLIEVAHGATETADFEALAARLEGPLPADLVDFFEVNTDKGAFELACAVAGHHAAVVDAQGRGRRVQVIRARIPRTFVDCNRNLAADAAAFKAGGVPPGLMPWVVSAADLQLLTARHAAYVSVVEAAISALPVHAQLVLMHTYAPRSLGVSVDLSIVPQLHAAYAPGTLETWPLRAEIDVIGRDAAGVLQVSAPVLAALQAHGAEAGIAVADSATYHLHPSTMGWHYAQALPERCICVEVRRDLLSPEGVFVPFSAWTPDPARVAALAEPIAQALLAHPALLAKPDTGSHP